MLYVLFAILLFGILIFVHELGHFLTARLFGVRVNEFSMGMGPAVFTKQGKVTKYSLRVLPIGGYCAMEGEDADSTEPDAFCRQRGWKQFIILAAGAVMNFIFGVVIIICLFSTASGFVTTTLSGVMDGSPSEGYLQAGDEILQINGKHVWMYSDVSTLLSMGNGETADFVVLRDGERVILDDMPCKLTEFTTDSGTSYLYGFNFAYEDATIMNRLSYSWRQTLCFGRMVWMGLEELLSGAVGIRDLSGPIGIVSTMSEVGEESESTLDAILNLLYFGAFIAINLGIMNLLPLPALDGGRIFILIINGITWALFRKKIPDNCEKYINAAGLLLLLGLMAVIAVSDLLKLAGI